MAVTILWSDEAKETFAKNVAYLQTAWTEKEVKKFLHRTAYVFLNIEDNPECYPISKKSKNIRRVILNKRVTMYYRYFPSKKMVVLLTFWNNYMDPSTMSA
jgi:plasmid stabilization system protein ParE